MRMVLVFCVYLAAMGASAGDLPDDIAKLVSGTAYVSCYTPLRPAEGARAPLGG